MTTATPTAFVLESEPPQLSDVDFTAAAVDGKKSYDDRLKTLRKHMLQIQQAYYHQGRRAVIVFEGWDAAGKGGAIRRLTAGLDPRGVRVHPIGAPRAENQARHYLFRFFQRLPTAGRLAIFDRSWYGRVLVERVEGFAAPDAWQRAYQEINEFERLLIDDGARVIKLFVHITKDEQLARFEQRLRDPVKRWKLTEEDIRNREKWPDYEAAIDDMFARTSTRRAPWCLVPGNKKWFARLAVLEHVTERLAEGVDISPPPLDPEIIRAAEAKLGITL